MLTWYCRSRLHIRGILGSWNPCGRSRALRSFILTPLVSIGRLSSNEWQTRSIDFFINSAVSVLLAYQQLQTAYKNRRRFTRWPQQNIPDMLSYLFVLSVLAWIAWSCITLTTNYISARRFRLPIVTIPFSPDGAIWIILQPFVLPLLERLPFGNGTFTRFCRFGWEWPDQAKSYREMGDAWILCTPVNNWVYLADSQAVDSIFSRPADFTRPLQLYSAFILLEYNVSGAV